MTVPHRRPPNFPTTRWSLVERANGQDATQALADLIVSYQPALRRFITRQFRLPSHDAEDFIQGFICDKLIQGTLLSGARQNRGRFRNLLCRSLQNYVISAIRSRRDAAWLTAGGDSAADPSRKSDVFDRLWARQVLALAVRRTRGELLESGRADFWHLLRVRVIRPALRGTKPPGYDQVLRQVRFSDPGQAQARLATAKRMLNRHLRDVVGDYSNNPAGVEEEIHALKRAVMGFGAR